MTRSNFPNAVDSLPELSNLLASDKTNVDRYKALLMQESRTTAEETELNNLKTILANKLIDAEYFNFLSDAITAVQEYFLHDVRVDLSTLDVGILRNDIDAHLLDKDNPHDVSVSQIGAVPNAREISTSNGLKGGGNLSSDRTISFDETWGNTRYLPVSGSNANGNYVKFPNGTLIISIEKRLPSTGKFYNGTWTYPVTVVGTPSGVVSSYNTYHGANNLSTADTYFGHVDGSQYRWGINLPNSAGLPTGYEVVVMVTVVGRWK